MAISLFTRKQRRERLLVQAHLLAKDIWREQATEERVDWLTEELLHAGDLFYLSIDDDFDRPRRVGKPRKTADVVFIYTMANTWAKLMQDEKFGWRIRDKRRKALEKNQAGIERPTVFQRFCRQWINQIDPLRPRDLTAYAFRKAKAHYEQGPNKNHTVLH